MSIQINISCDQCKKALAKQDYFLVLDSRSASAINAYINTFRKFGLDVERHFCSLVCLRVFVQQLQWRLKQADERNTEKTAEWDELKG